MSLMEKVVKFMVAKTDEEDWDAVEKLTSRQKSILIVSMKNVLRKHPAFLENLLQEPMLSSEEGD